jgi:hypothetical protein
VWQVVLELALQDHLPLSIFSLPMGTVIAKFALVVVTIGGDEPANTDHLVLDNYGLEVGAVRHEKSSSPVDIFALRKTSATCHSPVY